MSNMFVHSVKRSRQKSRKVLGMGENADGKIPRSKISQLLGNPISSPVLMGDDDRPFGLCMFQWIGCLFFLAVSTLGLFLPATFSQVVAVYFPRANLLSMSYRKNVADMEAVRATFMSASEPNRSPVSAADFSQIVDNLKSFMLIVQVQSVQIYCAACTVMCIYMLIIALRFQNNRVAIQSSVLLIGSYFTFEMIACAMFFNVEMSTEFACATLWRLSFVLLSVVYLVKLMAYRRNDIIKRE